MILEISRNFKLAEILLPFYKDSNEFSIIFENLKDFQVYEIFRSIFKNSKLMSKRVKNFHGVSKSLKYLILFSTIPRNFQGIPKISKGLKKCMLFEEIPRNFQYISIIEMDFKNSMVFFNIF